MMRLIHLPALAVALLVGACGDRDAQPDPQLEQATAGATATVGRRTEASSEASSASDFEVEAERFADLRILRYRVPGFEALDLDTKKLLYYLYRAAQSGREIIYDQKFEYNLAIKRTLEQIIRAYPGDRSTPDFEALLVYAKRIWFSNGIHHHYGNEKFAPGFSAEAFARFVRETPGPFPLRVGRSVDDLIAELSPVMFDPSIAAKLVDKRAGIDVVVNSAVNFYDDVTQAEVEAFYAARRDPNDSTPISYGLNSRLVGSAEGPIEQVWKVGGMYTEALEKLVVYYRSGDLVDWDDYNVAWVEDTASRVDAINGFIEVYNDPIGLRGSFESVVSFRDEEATRRIDAIAREAQWFEDNSPISDEHKKAEVTGITGKVITVVTESGDASPATPIGINLPNADWIRAEHGSKSVSLGNIVTAYNLVAGEAEREFAWDADEIARSERYGDVVDDLMTDMHEVIGHASGRLNPGVASPSETLKNYSSTLEEARADLVGLYFMIDPKLVEIGVLPSVDAGRIAYDAYIRNGLMQQLYRISPGAEIEEDHMRNRQLVAAWAYEMGRDANVIERRERDGKTYFVVNDYDALREIFGAELRELQRIKSEGDFEAIKALVEGYGVKVDAALHNEVLERYAKLDIPPYNGFINPRLVAVEERGEIVDVVVEYPDDFTAQMLEYADEFAFLPTWASVP